MLRYKWLCICCKWRGFQVVKNLVKICYLEKSEVFVLNPHKVIAREPETRLGLHEGQFANEKCWVNWEQSCHN